MKRSSKILLAVGIVAFVLFTIFDLQISMNIFNEQSAFGKFFEAFGELPMSYVGAFSSAALLVTTRKAAAWKFYLALVSFGILLVFFSFMSSFLVASHLNLPTWTVLLSTCVYIILFFLLAKAVPGKYRIPLRRAAIVGLILSFAAVLIITLLKMLWGRMRFRSMIDPTNEFTPWYLPQSFTTNNEFMSFPSGHAANSAVIMWITLLPTFIPVLKNKQLLLQIIVAIWIALVMISRVIMGAHFSTDVMMGMLISLGVFVLLRSKFIKSDSVRKK
ncbi:phosphatase PAP2 family protein [Paenilisteria weihenstephanensis]|nr:phosphatase PAP2 family protein [Listeria weihenstephanensis]